MPSLKIERDFRPLARLPFCYLCGGSLANGEPCNNDHAPPRKVFLAADRVRCPLILPTHERCNNGRTQEDELVSQIVGLMHGSAPRPERQRFSATMFRNERDGEIAGISDVALEETVWRWVRACHAALYAEFLPDGAQGRILSPWPAGYVRNDVLQVEPPGMDMREIAFLLRANIRAGNVDEIFAFTQKFRFSCTWFQADDGTPLCAFGVRVYDWERMTDTSRFPRRGCIGFYTHPKPALGTNGRNVGRSPPLFSLFDPFG